MSLSLLHASSSDFQCHGCSDFVTSVAASAANVATRIRGGYPGDVQAPAAGRHTRGQPTTFFLPFDGSCVDVGTAAVSDDLFALSVPLEFCVDLHVTASIITIRSPGGSRNYSSTVPAFRNYCAISGTEVSTTG